MMDWGLNLEFGRIIAKACPVCGSRTITHEPSLGTVFLMCRGCGENSAPKGTCLVRNECDADRIRAAKRARRRLSLKWRDTLGVLSLIMVSVVCSSKAMFKCLDL